MCDPPFLPTSLCYEGNRLSWLTLHRCLIRETTKEEFLMSEYDKNFKKLKEISVMQCYKHALRLIQSCNFSFSN